MKRSLQVTVIYDDETGCAKVSAFNPDEGGERTLRFHITAQDDSFHIIWNNRKRSARLMPKGLLGRAISVGLNLLEWRGD